MKRARVRVALIALIVPACAVLRAEPKTVPEQRLAQGLAALEQREFGRGRALLDTLYREHWQQPVGRHAMLALIASELDPRNPDRRLSAAADLSARYLRFEDIPAWHVPLAETLYLIAQELGAVEERSARAAAQTAEANAASAAARRELEAAESASGRALPTSPRESVPTRIRNLASERDDLKRRLVAAEQSLATRERELREAQAELERIRKTLTP
jgi:hypothetical protein